MLGLAFSILLDVPGDCQKDIGYSHAQDTKLIVQSLVACLQELQ